MKITKGWRLYAADFSIQAESNDTTRPGFVVLVRDPGSRAWWHTTGAKGPLYVSGRGRTFRTALINANINAKEAPATKQGYISKALLILALLAALAALVFVGDDSELREIQNRNAPAVYSITP